MLPLYPTAKMISSIPYFLSCMITYSMNGFPSTSAMGFGLSLTTLLSLVPRPPASNTACMSVLLMNLF